MNILHCRTRVLISINTFYLTSLSNKNHQCNVWCIKHQFKPKTASAITIFCTQTSLYDTSLYAFIMGLLYLKTIISFLTILIDVPSVQKDESRIKQWLYRQASVTKTQQASFLWRMIWAKSTYRNDSRRNPAVAGFWPIRERIRAVARYPATAQIRSLIGQNTATAGFLRESLR